MTMEEELQGRGFTLDQIAEIKEGEEAGLDVAVYAQKEFFAIQMRQIRLGMMEGLEVSRYASTDYDWFQMEEIRKGLKAGIATEIYAKPEIPYDKMRQLRKGLEAGIDLSPYVQLEAGILKQLRKALRSKINIVSYIKEGYNTEQLEEIRHGLEKGLKLQPFLLKEFRGASIREICKGLEKGVDVSVYAKSEYNWQQMNEIRLGMEGRLDISQYSSPFYSWQQMREIRLGLEEGLQVKGYSSLMYPAAEMKKIRLRMQEDGTAERQAKKVNIREVRNFSVSLSTDEMEAFVRIQGAEGELHREDIELFLKEQGIVRGIEQEQLDLMLKKEYNGQFVRVAKGRKPEKGEDGWYEFFFDTKLDKSPEVLENGSVDYRSVKWFEYVESGTTIAYYHEAGSGIEGYTVTGKCLPAIRGREMNMLTGKGFMLMPDKKTYLAATNGKIELNNLHLEISKLFILEDLTLATGNLEYDGSVYVRGNIGSGTLLKATEDIVVDGAVEGAAIECGGSVLLRQGANASGSGYIRAGKSVVGRFFEAIQVYAAENIQADYYLNCDLYAENLIIAQGRVGAIMGGVAYAARGYRLFDAGNKVGIVTLLKMGVGAQMQQKVMELESEIKEANKQMSILGNAYIDFQRKYPPEVRNSMDMYLKVENAIYTIENKLEKLYEKKTKADKAVEKIGRAKAIVKRNVYDGIVIELDGIRWNAARAQNVTIRKSNGQIRMYRN